MYTYHATLKRVVDGDTYDLVVDLGFSIHTDVRVRLLGIDTPETFRPKSPGEKQHAKECVDFIHELLARQPIIAVKTTKTGKYGRWLAEITLENGEDLASLLNHHGFAKQKDYPT